MYNINATKKKPAPIGESRWWLQGTKKATKRRVPKEEQNDDAIKAAKEVL